MPGNSSIGRWSTLPGRVRAWWDRSTYLGDVAVTFTAITVVNSVMMLTGSDEPKDGTFAYVHLLGRLGIIAVVVGAFHLDGARDRLVRWRRAGGPRGPGRQGSARAAIDAVLGWVARAPVESTARAFTAVVALTCVVTVMLADIRPAAGGPGLYRNLLTFAALLLAVMLAGSWWRRRCADASPSDRS